MSLDEAVVLAAGEGTRLRPLTRHRPKPMLPAANRPILEYVFDALIDAGITRISTVVGYKRDRVQNHFGSQYRDTPIQYVHQEKQLGSGHALLQAQGTVSGQFLVVNGDQIVQPELIATVRDAVDENGTAVAKLAVLEREEIGAYGAVELTGDRVTSFVEKPQSDAYHLLNAGVYAFGNQVFEFLTQTSRRDGELSLSDTIALMIESNNSVRAVKTQGLWIDATYPWDLLTVGRELVAADWIDVPQTDPGTWVADSASVHETAVLEPPVVIGHDCVIGPGSIVGSNSALGRNVTVGSNTVVERSIIDSDTRVGTGNVVIDCVTGQSVSIGAGTMIPGGQSQVVVANEVHPNQRLGAVLADRVEIGGAVSIAPGTLVGPNAVIHAGAHVRGTIPADAEVLD